MLKKKQKVLTHAERITEAQGKLQTAQIMFVQARDEVDAADDDLDAVVAETLEEMAELEARLEAAQKSKDLNAKFKAKLTEFIDL